MTRPRRRPKHSLTANDAQPVARSRLRPLRRPLLRATAVAVAAAAAMAGNPGAGSWVRSAGAQQAQSIVIRVAPVTHGEAASKIALPIEVGPKEAIAKNSFMRIRGLPPTVALSEGHAIAPGAWAVPLLSLPNLKLFLPAGLQGTSEVAISLIGSEGTVMAEARTKLTVAPGAAPARPGGADPQSSASAGPTPPKLDPADRERALALHAKGLEQLERGNVYVARKFFERAAEVGLAQSAVAVAGTYDPDELAKLNVVGLEPDIEAARKWYEKARELGAVEAGARLRRLGSRR